MRLTGPCTYLNSPRMMLLVNAGIAGGAFMLADPCPHACWAAHASGTKIRQTAAEEASVHLQQLLSPVLQQRRRWALSQGQDFITNHQIPAIDFYTFHSWVDNWFDDDLSFQTAWIAQHAADAAYIGKPVGVDMGDKALLHV